jgi:hypothetical protein
MEIPQQVINTLAGTDVVLVPAEEEGTVPMPSEDFVRENIEALIALGMMVVVDPETFMALVYNPSFHDTEELKVLALEGRLAEYVNGLGKNQKPINPQAMVKVSSKGQPVRDILVDNVEAGINAGQRNLTADNEVEVLPVTRENLLGTLETRGRRPQVEMPPPSVPQITQPTQ